MHNLTDYQYALICTDVYYLDQKEYKDHSLHKGQTVNHTNLQYKIVYALDDSLTGFQGMAIMPKLSNDFDSHQIYISFAGTNPNDPRDLYTDATQIRQAREKLNTAGSGDQDYAQSKSQFNVVDRFWTHLIKKIGLKSTDIKGITAHSLGGALALYLGARHHLPVITFSSADPRDRLTISQIEYINKHPDQYINYYHSQDWIANWQSAQPLGRSIIAQEYSSIKSDDPTVNLLLNGHYLDSYDFTSTGQTAFFAQFNTEALKQLPTQEAILTALKSKQVQGQQRQYLIAISLLLTAYKMQTDITRDMNDLIRLIRLAPKRLNDRAQQISVLLSFKNNLHQLISSGQFPDLTNTNAQPMVNLDQTAALSQELRQEMNIVLSFADELVHQAHQIVKNNPELVKLLKELVIYE
ncbi:alpha/beta hydrolase family protein [Convivina praedatoris]|uniref:Fungal lipase-like domain-containing protein n=1 Tax=Convivina praedatoris TaxID=2880963 RepID=A0ABM9D4J2_9LACO|nr:hypothetical protein [Convivina sp. LMG 32447]CAH1856883.1 hypothetical protein R077815_01489 [Convivina sp. LMG 32447]CAH1857176.1 hypothetical protein R078138_01521 [Convivina sp. LMG 32447]CAH1857406.1 hypothetical protein LMG032447_01521 [Convivina sp. LMG 32447]